MKALRNERQAHHVIAWGGCMNPNRLHAQHFTPRPARRMNWFRRVLRAVVGSMT